MPILSKRKNNHSNNRRDRALFRPFGRRSEVGDLPGLVAAKGESHPTTVNYFTFDKNAFIERQGLDAKAVQGIVDKPGHVTWIDVIGLADAEIIELLGSRYGIHPLLQEDIVHTHQRAKVEIHEGSVALILRMVESTAPLVSEQITFLLCGATVITFQERIGDSFEPVRRRIRSRLGSIRSLGADYTFYALIDTVIDGFFPLMEAYGKTLEELEDAIDSGINSAVQQRVHSIRSEMSQVRKIAWAQRDAIQRLVTEADGLVQPATLPFLRDCLDHTGQVLDVAEIFRDVAGDMRDLYFTQISLRTNDVMKLLTIISTIFMPLSFIAGVYGMNFNADISEYNMPETQWYFGYPFVLGVMAATATVMLGYFHRKGWLFGQ